MQSTLRLTLTVLGFTKARQASLIISQAKIDTAGGTPLILQAEDVVVAGAVEVLEDVVETLGVVEGAAGVVLDALEVVEGAFNVVLGALGVVDGALGVVLCALVV